MSSVVAYGCDNPLYENPALGHMHASSAGENRREWARRQWVSAAHCRKVAYRAGGHKYCETGRAPVSTWTRSRPPARPTSTKTGCGVARWHLIPARPATGRRGLPGRFTEFFVGMTILGGVLAVLEVIRVCVTAGIRGTALQLSWASLGTGVALAALGGLAQVAPVEVPQWPLW